MNYTPTVARFNLAIDPQEAAKITLDAPKFLPADARHISRILKAAGHVRAGKQGTGQYSHGFNVSGNNVRYFGSQYDSREQRLVSLAPLIETLRDQGFVVANNTDVYKPVRSADDESTFWQNLRIVYVAWGDALVPAHHVPAFVQERDRIRKAAAENSARYKAEAKAATERRDALQGALKDTGLNAYAAGPTGITVNSDDLARWLKAKGILL